MRLWLPGCQRIRTTSVLLLEAGPDNTSAGTPAGIRARNWFKAYDEPGRLWPNVRARRAVGQPETFYRRGRGIGGSSAVNAMGALRGTPDDYQRWVDEFGCDGWGWPEMLATFLYIEDDVDYGGDDLHGKGGPIPLARLPFAELAPVDMAVRAALEELGYPECDDYHAAGATGISRWAFTWRDGCRVSTNDAYLEPARGRGNLTIRGDAHVDRLLMDGRRAVGVRIATGEEIEGGEVVLSAGAIHSPPILLRSGIGVDDGLPVGKGLKDHPTAVFQLNLKPHARRASVDDPVVGSLLRYSSGLGRRRPQRHADPLVRRDRSHRGGPIAGPVTGSRDASDSAGEVSLRSDDPHDDPIVDLCSLSDHRDLIRLRDGVRRMVDIVQRPSIVAISEQVIVPNSTLEQLVSDNAIEEWLPSIVGDYVHVVGTCRMGRPGDHRAVVDLDCAVHGYQALRVVDASVMPDLPKCNTHLTTVAIAERFVQRHRS